VKTTIFVSNITYLLANRSTLDSVSLIKTQSLVGLSSLDILTIIENAVWRICDYWFGKGNAKDPIINTSLGRDIISLLTTIADTVRYKQDLTHQVYILADELHLVVRYRDTV